MTRLLVLPALLLLFSAVPAAAQIYTWTDEHGRTVVSNRRKPVDGEVSTYEVPGSPSVRSTTPVTSARSQRYDELIQTHANQQGLSPMLVKAVIQAESAFNPWAISPKGAQGLMQLMPATARELGVTDPFHPEQNIRGGVSYLKRLMDMYDQDVTLALAAYNAGPGAVAKYGAVPPYRETRDYVRKITTAAPPPPKPAPVVIYKWIDIVNGKPMARYANKPPLTKPYEIVSRR